MGSRLRVGDPLALSPLTHSPIVVSSTIQLQSPLHLGEALVGSRLRAGDPLVLSPLSHRPVVVSSTQPRLSLRVLFRLWVEVLWVEVLVGVLRRRTCPRSRL